MNTKFDLICKICQKEGFAYHTAFTNHLKIHKTNSQSYYDQYIKERENLCECGTHTKWRGILKGYAVYCPKCAHKHAARKQWDGNVERKDKLRESCKKYLSNKGRPKGSKNKSSYPRTDKVLERFKNHPPPSWTGRKHTEEYYDHMSKITTERIRMNGRSIFYRGKFIPKHPEKYAGNVTNIIYRSSWEHKVMRFLDASHNVVNWSSEELIIPYYDPTTKRTRRYFPDFVVKVKRADGSSTTYILEVKPLSQTTLRAPKRQTRKFLEEAKTYAVNQAKWHAAEEFCKDNGWIFKVITENEIFMGKDQKKTK